MTDALLAEKPDLEETWMRGAMLKRLGAVRLEPNYDRAFSCARGSLADRVCLLATAGGPHRTDRLPPQ
jgi:hypothetical protein